MQPAFAIPSPPVYLDLTNECLWRGAQAIPLRPKTFTVLRYLVEHPGQLVTKAALLDAVWPETTVSDGGLMVCLHELRRALGDDPKVPQFIETVHRRGYRFIGHLPVTTRPRSLSPQSSALSPVMPVGREAELGHLHQWLERALSGARQVVFVTGEVGLGKTTLVETFGADVSRDRRLWVGRGQCIEYYGAGEAYMPVLEAFGRLGQEPGGQDLLALLARHAPTWLVQMPWLVSAAELEALQRRIVGATQQRMLREMAEAIVELTAIRPLVLILEDLHWSDYSTLDLLAVLARRREPARLLLIGTYRPEDVRRSDHPLRAVKQELQMHGHCAVLPLTFLTEEAITEYLAARFPGLTLPGQVAHFVHQRTDGNPLFMVNVVESWLAQGRLVEQAGKWVLPAGIESLQAGIPESLRQMIEQQLDRLSAEKQRVVEAASVAGVEFSAAAVAAGIGQEVVQVEACCADLARRGQLLQASGEKVWPDRTVAGCYSFVHALYQEVLYNRVPAAQRVHLHRCIGERVERGYGAQAGDIAAELAMHFERGQDSRRAVAYLRHAADNALRRHANTEAIHHLTKGLTLLKTLLDTPERSQQELDLLIALGPALMAAKGYGASEVEHTYAQALQLCQQAGNTPRLFPTLVGLRRFYLLRAELQTARTLCERLLNMAQQAQDPALLLEAHWGLGVTLCFLGEFASSRQHSERGRALYDTQQHRAHAFLYGDDPGVGCLSYAALALWFLGYADQALERIHAALTLAQKLSHPFSLAYVLGAAAWLHQYRREPQATYTYGEAKVALSQARGFPMRQAQGTILRGWALAAQGQREEGIAQIRQGLAAFRTTGGELNRTYYLALLAEVYGQGGQVDEGLRVLTEALAGVQSGRERWWEAELYRLKGETLLAQADTKQKRAEAAQYFHVALETARHQQAKSLELRAATSLSRLWQQQGKRDAARQLLAEVYGWFTEGFVTADLCEARALLAELSCP